MRLLISFLLFSLTSSAQVSVSKQDSSFVSYLDLPSSEPFDTNRSWNRIGRSLVYIISDRDLHDLFGYPLALKFPEPDFSRYHILGVKAREGWVWLLRNNEKSLREVVMSLLPASFDTLPGYKGRFYDDTLIRSVNGTTTAKWYTAGHGDCHARFDYKLYTDIYYPVLLLKEWNYWGGCRAGGTKNFTVSFTMPAGIIYSFKNTILAERRFD